MRRRQARRMAILKLRWFNVCTDLEWGSAQRDQALHQLEVEIRQLKAAVWKSIPDCKRWVGTGKKRHQLNPDSDRWATLHQLDADAHGLVQAIHARHTPQGRPEPSGPSWSGSGDSRAPERFGPFEIELADLGWALDASTPLIERARKLQERHHRMNEPIRYRPGGTPSQPPAPPPPSAPPTPDGRPQVPERLPMEIDAALAMEMPFGKYQGHTLDWMLGDSVGMGYLWWLCEKAEIKSPRLREALDVIWTHYEGELEDANRHR